MWQGGTGNAVSVLTTVYSGVPPSYNTGAHQGYSMSNMTAASNVYHHNPHRVAGSMGVGPVSAGPQQQDQIVYSHQGGGAGPAYHCSIPGYHGPSTTYNQGSAGPVYGTATAAYQRGVEPTFHTSSRPVKNVDTTPGDLTSTANVTSQDTCYGAPSSVHWNSNSSVEPPEASIAAAAAMNAVQVAAAAVATATATAVALDQSQFHHEQYSQQNAPYCPPQQFSTSVGMVHQGQYVTNPRLVPNRVAAAQMPGNYSMTASRNRGSVAPMPVNGAMYQNVPGTAKAQTVVPPTQPSMSVLPAGHHVQYPSTTGGSRSYGPGPAASTLYGSTIRAIGSTAASATNPVMRNIHYGTSAQPAYGNAVGYGPHPIGQTATNYQQQQRLYVNSNAASVGICGGGSNPTPPMTPVNSSGIISPPGYTSAMVKNAANMRSVDMKPMVNCQLPDDDILTLPVPDGVVMTPFRLEHNSPVTQHLFFLNDNMFNFLCSSPENDLQDEKIMSCNWPPNANVQICVNGTPVPLLNNNKPLYIKQLCQPNKNMLQISVQQCSCSHLFEVSLVQRINIETVRENLMRRRILPQDQAREKMKRLFFTGDFPNVRQTDGYGADIEQMSINISLRCPLSMQKIRYPARGQMCRHPQCFDVETFLRLNKDRNKWFCPLCKIELHLDSLEIDQYVWGILCNFKDSLVDEITIDSALMWKACCKASVCEDSRAKIKQEHPGPCNRAKRFKSDANAAQTPNSWSPYSNDGNNCLPPTPGALTSSAGVLSPSFGAATSPAQPVGGQSQRHRSGNNHKPSTPRAPLNVCVTSSSVSMSSPLYTTAATPGTPIAASSTIGGGNPPSVELIVGGNNMVSSSTLALQSQTSQPNGSQSDACFASASAPYAPASVGSNGSLTHGSSSGGGSNMPSDNYGQDLYGNLESLLTDSNPNDTSGLFADSMDPMELLKYLDNGTASSSSVDPNNLKLLKNAQKSDSIPSKVRTVPNYSTTVEEPIDNSSTKNPILYSNKFSDSGATRQLTLDEQKQGDLSNLDDVLSFLN